MYAQDAESIQQVSTGVGKIKHRDVGQHAGREAEWHRNARTYSQSEEVWTDEKHQHPCQCNPTPRFERTTVRQPNPIEVSLDKRLSIGIPQRGKNNRVADDEQVEIFVCDIV